MARSDATGTHPNDDLLVALHDGVLFPGDKPAIEQHVQSCARCRGRLATLTATSASIADNSPRSALSVRSASAVKAARRAVAVAVALGVVSAATWLVRRELTRRSAEPISLAAAPTTPEPTPAPTIADIPAPPAPVTPDAPEDSIVSTTPTPPIDIISPNRNFRWRVVGLEVERSTDGGLVWRPQMVELTNRVTAGVAPSAAVCWLVGNNGAVFVAVGSDWKDVSLPQAANLVTVAAIDSTNATVTAEDGRQFSTSDQGMTWNPLQ